MYLVVLIIKQAVPHSGRLAQQLLSVTEMRGQLRYLSAVLSKRKKQLLKAYNKFLCKGLKCNFTPSSEPNSSHCITKKKKKAGDGLGGGGDGVGGVNGGSGGGH